MDDNILVSVVMSVYNGEKYLRAAVESILNQTYKNLEFLIINDGSTDKTMEILKTYDDKRIRILDNDGNKGLIYSLNRGFREAKGKYIARMDADDIALENRFYDQVKYLEENQDIAMCDGGIKIFKDNLTFITKTFISTMSSDQMKTRLLFKNCITHPATMIRTKSIRELDLKYNIEDKGMEDFGLWIHMSKFVNLGKVPSVILKYRYLSTSISANVLQRIENYKKTLKNCFKREYKEIFDNFSEKDLDIHIEICVINNLKKYNFTLEEKLDYLKRLESVLLNLGSYDQKSLMEEINERRVECYINQSSLLNTIKINKKEKLISLEKLLFIKSKKFLKKILR